MKLGTINLWGDDPQAFRADVRLAEELGYDVVGVGDSPAAAHDVYAALMVAAGETRRAILAPMVTGPYIRHPLVAANAMSTLDELSGGRAVMGFGAGGSLGIAVGRGLAKTGEVREYLAALRRLFAGESATFEGLPVAALRHARRIPIYFSAKGPRNLRLAGEIADGVILFAGADLAKLDEDLAAVRQGAREAGRDPAEIDVWAFGYTAIGETRSKALKDISAFLVVNGRGIRSPEALARVPTQFRGKIEELHSRYDVSDHAMAGGRNAALIEELGLAEYLAQMNTVAGAPEEVKAVLDAFAARGVSTFFMPLSGHADRQRLMRQVAAMMELQPRSMD